VSNESKRPPLSHASGTPVTDNLNIQTAGPRGPALLQDVWLIEKLAHFHREVIPERRMHAKGSGAHGTFTVTHDITRYTKAKIFSQIGEQTPMFMRAALGRLAIAPIEPGDTGDERARGEQRLRRGALRQRLAERARKAEQ
jgi:catalase